MGKIPGNLIFYSFKKRAEEISASQLAPVVKNLPTNAGDARDAGSIPESERSSGGGHDNPLWYSCPGTEEPGGLQYMGLQRVQTRLK